MEKIIAFFVPNQLLAHKEERIPDGWNVQSIQCVSGNTGTTIVYHLKMNIEQKQATNPESQTQS